MQERQFQAKLLKALRSHPELVNAVLFKHTDARNGGIPDISITVHGNTSWFELKVAPNVPTKLQMYYLHKLGKRAHVVRLKGTLIDVDGYAYLFQRAVKEIVRLCVTP